MKRIVAAAVAAVVLALPAVQVEAWGSSGHRLIGVAAMRALPADLPAFLRTPGAVADIGELTPVLSRELASLAVQGSLPGITLAGLRQSSESGHAAVALDVDVERPQDLAYPIKAVEPVAVVFPFTEGPFSVVSLRPDFPDTLHQNWSPPGGPCALCIDDRPWAEARLTVSAQDIARRIQLWLARAARGELHDPAQPPDPLFFSSQIGLILPAAALVEGQEPIELAGMIRPDNENLIISRPAVPNDPHPPAFTVLAFQAEPQAMAQLRHAPDTLTALAAELEPHGIRLIDQLKSRLKTWKGLGPDHVRRLSTRLAIVVAFPIAVGERPGVNDVRAFLTYDTAGDIGVALGVLYLCILPSTVQSSIAFTSMARPTAMASAAKSSTASR